MANQIKDNYISKADYYKFENNKLVKSWHGGHDFLGRTLRLYI